jgi:hypothetical protein
MGQYYFVANLDKEEYMSPHKVDSGAKAREWLYDGNLTRLLGLLLIDGDARGGGDVFVEMAGRWAKDRIVICGDYADDEPDSEKNIYTMITEEGSSWVEISNEIVASLKQSERSGNDPWAQKINTVELPY